MFDFVIWIMYLFAIFLLYAVIRVTMIQHEINRTWKIKKWGFIENLIKEPILRDIEARRKELEHQNKNKSA